MKKIVLGILTFMIAGAVIALVYQRLGRSSKVDLSAIAAQKSEEQEVLVDCCDYRTGTPGYDGYTEAVLYRNPDGSLEMHIYTSYGLGEDTKEKEESHEAWTADPSAAEQAYAVINREKITAWNSRYPGPGPDGAYYSLRFRLEDGSYYSASSDHMPEDGVNILSEVRRIVEKSAMEKIQIK